MLRAAVVLPISRPPIRDGAVLVRGNRIAALGPRRELEASPGAERVDLGRALLFPGLVNAHCHLDYTGMAGQFPPPKVFTDWLKLITEAKSGWSLADYRASWRSGAEMLMHTGVTTVGDIEAVAQLLPGIWQATPLRVISFLEIIGATTQTPAAELVRGAARKISRLNARRPTDREANRPRDGRCSAHLSPHAPYSTRPELLQLAARAARRFKLRVCVHVGESALEYEMFRHGRGVMHDWLMRSGRDNSDCGRGTPVQHLESCGVLGANLLAAHANCLGIGDARRLAERGVSVVHCPRSHHYFRHPAFPLRRLLRAGVNVCLGTDSLASVCRSAGRPLELSLLAEMRALAKAQDWLRPAKIIEMATRNGARALGLEGKAGELRAGAFADLAAIPLENSKVDPYEALLEFRGRVGASMINGHWAIAPAARA